MQAVPDTYICLDDQGIPHIAGTTIKVIEIVREKNAWGMTPEEIQSGHPHLSLGQVYAALAYYYDHKEEVDADLARRDRFVEGMHSQADRQVTRRELELRLKDRQTD